MEESLHLKVNGYFLCLELACYFTNRTGRKKLACVWRNWIDENLFFRVDIEIVFTQSSKNEMLPSGSVK